ncbi:MAG: bifunctional hydroxymethylpyrimidine kinase/phosphomethylpyrimidine kinase [Deltaproteobacteria bacterium]|nr:bifunctional hydroxymethylpyrimidine kinase/phosphomethylpyrimidine kinase [Deltaproteobacteria bacterium]
MQLPEPVTRPLCALTIAGSDSGGGAGIQADLRTFAAHGLLGCTAVTAITAQNTLTVTHAQALDASLVVAQLDAVLADLPIRAAKTGMLATAAIVRAVASYWAGLERPLPLVVDPVMVSTGGDRLLDPDAIDAMRRLLLPLATVLTPNLPEAAALLGADEVADPEDCVAALAALCGPHTTVVLKGGHRDWSPRAADLVRLPDGRHFWLDAPRIDTRCDHGTGCTFAAAIAANLALGLELRDALLAAKQYLTGAMRTAAPLGAGHSPVDHLWQLRRMVDADEG